MSDSYIAETSYKAYVFVNTGQENGKYKNSQDMGKEEAFDDSKVLGQLVIRMGTLSLSKPKTVPSI